jgi:hypothetical protein
VADFTDSGWQEVCGGVVLEIRGCCVCLACLVCLLLGTGRSGKLSVGGDGWGVELRLQNGEYQTQMSSNGIEQCFG